MILRFCVMSSNHHVSEKMYNVSNIWERKGKRECRLFASPSIFPFLLSFVILTLTISQFFGIM
ncbi:MAG: hypothetical protein DRG83_04465 [Deltaproteobacteria bacterium]|nr:MAG: hypothetical protein DRG83_04465 [Deltaproteobacteria bacterium]